MTKFRFLAKNFLFITFLLFVFVIRVNFVKNVDDFAEEIPLERDEYFQLDIELRRKIIANILSRKTDTEIFEKGYLAQYEFHLNVL